MKITDDMVERAAKALYIDDGYLEACWPLEMEKRRKPYFLAAEAALEAALRHSESD